MQPSVRDSLLALLGSLVLFAAPAQAQVPQLLAYHGRLAQTNGVSLTGEHTVTFRIYDVESGGAELWKEPHQVTLTVSDNGLFSTVLGSVKPLESLNFNKSLWLSIEVDTEGEMTPRQRLAAVGYAINADTLDGLDSTQFARLDAASTVTKQLTLTHAGVAVLIKPDIAPPANAKVVDVQTPAGETQFSIDAEGDVAVAGNLTVTGAISGSNTTGGTVTSVDSGAGLSGGPITSSGTLAVGAGDGIAVSADAVAVNVASGAGLTAGSTGLSLLQTCTDGQLLKWTATTGAWACAADIDTDTNAGGTVTSVASGAGLTGGPVTGSGTLAVGAGSGISVNADDVAVDVATTSTTLTTSANSGLEASTDGLRLLGGCTDGQVLKWNATTTVWNCQNDADTNSGGTITAVTAGTGLSGGGTGGAITLNVGSGTGVIVGADSIAVDVGTGANQVVQLDAAGKLPAVDGSALISLNASQLASGTVPDARVSSNVSLLGASIESAEIADGTISAADTADAFLVQGSGVTLTKGSSSWTISATGTGGDITGVTAGTGLSGGGSSGDVTVSLSTPVSVADGGTGGATAAAARTNLSAAASGANSDITSLTGLTTALSVGQGGTGGSTLTDGGLLIGKGTSAVTTTGVLSKGTLLVGDGATDPTQLSVGSDRTMLRADSAQGSGLKWVSGCFPVGGVETSSRSATFQMAVFATGSNDAGSAARFWPVPVAGKVDNLQVYVDTAPGSGKSWTVTVRKNDADTSLSCVISGTGKTCSATGAVSFSAGDRLGVRSVEGGSASGTNGSGWSTCFIPD